MRGARRSSRQLFVSVIAGACLLAATGATASTVASTGAAATGAGLDPSTSTAASTDAAATQRTAVAIPSLAGMPPLRVEVLTGGGQVLAYRLGRTITAGQQFAWYLPHGAALALDRSWWNLVATGSSESLPAVHVPAGLNPAAGTTRGGGEDPGFEVLAATSGDIELLEATTGDVDGDGVLDTVLLFRRAARPTAVSAVLGPVGERDSRGYTLHLGIYDAHLNQKWVAGTVFQPISQVAACTGAIAFASPPRPGQPAGSVGTSRWAGFGFVTDPGLPELPGPGIPSCADVDGDGVADVLVLKREPEER